MANNKVYSRAEMQEAGIVTCDYAFMDKPGEYIGNAECVIFFCKLMNCIFGASKIQFKKNGVPHNLFL
ncbi:MAG: hypothetical protein UHC59_07400 [Fibrobacteraceae bacterium]|nr:hypothetical protein [Fibrobacteraceae bacterium]